MSVGFIWPRWEMAKTQLVHAVLNCKNQEDVESVIQKWFEITIFEMGVQTKESKFGPINDEGYVRHQAEMSVRHLAHEIVENDALCTRIESETQFERVRATTILVVALPRFVQDKNKVLKYVRD